MSEEMTDAFPGVVDQLKQMKAAEPRDRHGRRSGLLRGRRPRFLKRANATGRCSATR